VYGTLFEALAHPRVAAFWDAINGAARAEKPGRARPGESDQRRMSALLNPASRSVGRACFVVGVLAVLPLLSRRPVGGREPGGPHNFDVTVFIFR
jgi:hypothetical protein